MANNNQQQNTPAAGKEVSLTIEQLTAILAEARKPYIDPNVEASKERNKQRMRDERVRGEQNKAARESNCTHLREDNTSRIAWMQNSDGVSRGVCQFCQKMWTDPKAPDYLQMLRMPTRTGNTIGY